MATLDADDLAAIAALIPTSSQISAQIASDWDAIANGWGDAFIQLVDGYVVPSVGGTGFDTATDSLEAIRNRGDAAWTGGGGGSIDTEQLLADLIAGLGSVEITRIGPEYNPATRAITLIAGDDYLAANGNALTFAVTFPGVDLSAATAVYGGSGDYLDLLNGSATLIDIDTATPKLRLEWTREQTNKTPSKKYCWGVAIIVGGKVQTVVGGNLILKPPLVPIAIVDAELA